MLSFLISFGTLNLTSAEWNYYWFDMNQPAPILQMLIRAFKVTPFFLLPIIYKTISWALLVTLLGYYSIICVVVVLAYQASHAHKAQQVPFRNFQYRGKTVYLAF